MLSWTLFPLHDLETIHQQICGPQKLVAPAHMPGFHVVSATQYASTMLLAHAIDNLDHFNFSVVISCQ